MHTFIHMFTCMTCMHKQMDTHTLTHTIHTYTCMRICMHMNTHTHIYTQRCMHGHTHTRTHTRTKHTHAHTHTRTHMHTHTHTHTHACIHPTPYMHLSLNHEGLWGTTDDFATSFLHFSLFSTALWDLVNPRPVHSLILSSNFFSCLPCLLPPFTVPCKMVLARPDERET